METEGYLIVLKPEQALRTWEATPWVKEQIEKYPEAYRAIRRAFSQFDPKAYRGISREPLEAIDPKKVEEYKKAAWDIDMLDACVRMYDLLHEKIERCDVDEGEDVFVSLQQATEVHGLLENQSDYEIIGIRRIEYEVTPGTLGFDVGYWGADFFSLIADTIVIPQWHVPWPEDYSEVAEKHSGLNGHLLFDTSKNAAYFRSYYKSKEWAETEDEEGEFCVIQVDEVRTKEL